MITNENLKAISEELDMTFGVVDEFALSTLMTEADQFKIRRTIQKYVPDSSVSFKKTSQLSPSPQGNDIWLIHVYPALNNH